MNAYSLQQNMLALVAATVMGLIVLAAPNAQAADQAKVGDGTAAFEQGLLPVEYSRVEAQNPAQLRRLLSATDLSARERRELQRTLDGLYEELG